MSKIPTKIGLISDTHGLLREEALEAVRAGWLNWIEQHEIQTLSRRIANPAGRLAITLEMAKLSSLSGLAGR